MAGHFSRGVLVATILLLLGPETVRAQFAGGDKSASKAWLVDTAAQLDAVRTNRTAHFRQIADIDLGVAPWNEGAGRNLKIDSAPHVV